MLMFGWYGDWAADVVGEVEGKRDIFASNGWRGWSDEEKNLVCGKS